LVQCYVGREAQCELQDARRGGGARRRARRRSRDARRDAERKRGAERRGARGSRVSCWKDRLPGCDAGRGTKGCETSTERERDAGHEGESVPRRRGTRGGARPRYTVEHLLDRIGVCGRRCPPMLQSWAHSRREKRGQGKRCKGDERKYPLTFHSWVPSSHQGSRERRFESRKRLRKIGSCNSLNSQREPIPTQLPPSAVRKIRWGRARVCCRGASRQSYVQELRPSEGET
jgi:hypothetical protein